MNYIPPNKGTLYRLIARLSPCGRYGWLLCTAALITGVWFLAIYRPVQAYIDSYVLAIGELYKQHCMRDQSCKNSAHLDNDVHTMQRDLIAYAACGQDVIDKGVVLFIVDQADEAGLHFISCMHEAEQEDACAIHERMRFVFEGTMEHIALFLHNLAVQPLGIECLFMDINFLRPSYFSLSCVFDVYTLKASCMA